MVNLLSPKKPSVLFIYNLNKEFDMDKPKYIINNTKKVFVGELCS